MHIFNDFFYLTLPLKILYLQNDDAILETIHLINIKTATVYFDEYYNFGTEVKNSIVKGRNITSFTGNPVDSCIEGLNHLIN